ncbi:MAG: hypothetical protein ACLFPB_01615 [Desulfovermiculus sp.]
MSENYRSGHKPNGTDPWVCGSCRESDVDHSFGREPLDGGSIS